MVNCFILVIIILLIIYGIDYLTNYKSGFKWDSKLYDLPTLQCTQDNIPFLFLIDTGANWSYLFKDSVSSLRLKSVDNGQASFTAASSEGTVLCWANMNFQFRDRKFSEDFAVIDKPNGDIPFIGVLGSNFFTKNNIVIDFNKNILYI